MITKDTQTRAVVALAPSCCGHADSDVSRQPIPI
jgi:hypothetical protein